MHVAALTRVSAALPACRLAAASQRAHACSARAAPPVVMAAATDAACERFTGGDEGALRTWLEEHGVSTAAWGTGNAKRVKDLLGEVADAESTLLLRDGAPLRQLRMCVALRRVRACSWHGTAR
jgi:hypothetical protein